MHTHLSACRKSGIDDLIVHGTATNSRNACGVVHNNVVELLQIDKNTVLDRL